MGLILSYRKELSVATISGFETLGASLGGELQIGDELGLEYTGCFSLSEKILVKIFVENEKNSGYTGFFFSPDKLFY